MTEDFFTSLAGRKFFGEKRDGRFFFGEESELEEKRKKNRTQKNSQQSITSTSIMIGKIVEQHRCVSFCSTPKRWRVVEKTRIAEKRPIAHGTEDFPKPANVRQKKRQHKKNLPRLNAKHFYKHKKNRRTTQMCFFLLKSIEMKRSEKKSNCEHDRTGEWHRAVFFWAMQLRKKKKAHQRGNRNRQQTLSLGQKKSEKNTAAIVFVQIQLVGEF